MSILRWDKRIVQMEKENPNQFMRAMLQNGSDFMEKFDFEIGKEPEPEEEVAE